MKNRYLHGPAIDQVRAEETVDSMGLSDDVYWQLADNLGSIRDVVNYDGIDTATVVKHLTFGAFGNITSDSNMSIDVRFAYTGREFDIETGLYCYRARYYDADNGRFVSEDPIVFAGDDANLARCVFNSPSNFVDPSGHGLYWWIPDWMEGDVKSVGTDGRIYITTGWIHKVTYPMTPSSMPSQWKPCSSREDWEKETGQAISELEYEIGKALATQAAQVAGAAALGPLHHIATSKNFISKLRGGPWSQRFARIFSKTGMTLEDAANKVRVPGHYGPHPAAYHREIYNRLQEATEGLCGKEYTKALRKVLAELAEEVSTPGTRLNRLITK